MKPIRRILLVLTCAAVVTLTAAATADTKLDITNWKEILPDAMYTKLVEEAIGKLPGYTASPSQFAQNAKRVQAEATNLIVYAEIAHRAGNANATALRDEATKLLEAATAKKADVAKEVTANLVKYKSLSSPGKGGDSDLAKSTKLDIIMKNPIKEINGKITSYKRMTAAKLASEEEAFIRSMYKVASLSVAVTAHAPTTDLPMGKTTKDWNDATEAMRKHALEAAVAAKNKKLAEMKAAVNNMDAACTKCHQDFRIETN